MPARERERGELPSPIWSPFDRKVERGLFASWERRHPAGEMQGLH